MFVADLGQHDRGPDQPEGPVGRPDRLHRSGFRKVLQAVGRAPAALLVRLGGWHLVEEHFVVDGEPISGSLFDLGLYAFHNARTMAAQGATPAFYLPKLESHPGRGSGTTSSPMEERLGLPKGASRPRFSSRRCPPPSRWTKSSTKCATTSRASIAAGGTTSSRSSSVSKEQALPHAGPFGDGDGQGVPGGLFALVIKTRHRCSAFAMGGMAAQIPVKNDPAANEAAREGARRQGARGG